jgi:oxygen-independent coproporphyrinogen-3 oxidase
MRRRSDSGNRGPDAAPTRASGLVPAEGTPLYVHLPYCVAKCTYCDFFSVTPEEGEAAAVVDLVLAEAGQRAPRAPRTVFLGGGTPSLLAGDDLGRLLEGLDRLTGFRTSAAEVTLECNPESLDEEKARLLRAHGVDRLSIGFQSLDPAILALFGRVHSPEESFAAFRAARAAGFERVSVDLIYAVPGQTPGGWERDLERVLALGPDHVSAYSLAFEEGTALTRDLERGRVERLPEEVELTFFRSTRARLEAEGFFPYEISNFASNGQRCAHNENYWRNGAYVGLGPAAVSQLGGTRFGNPRSVGAWRTAVAASNFPASWEETLTPSERLAETWWLGLRTAEGVSPGEARHTAGLGPGAPGEEDPCEALARELGSHGLLLRVAGRWRLSEAGLPLADAVSARFLDATARAVAGGPPE